MRSVLKPLVTVEDQSISDLFILCGFSHGLFDQSNRTLSPELMSYNKIVVQVLYCGQVCPTFACQDMGNICDPLLVGTGGNEIAV